MTADEAREMIESGIMDDLLEVAWLAVDMLEAQEAEERWRRVIEREKNPILREFKRREMPGYHVNEFGLRQWLGFLINGWDYTICMATWKEEQRAYVILGRWLRVFT